MLKPGKRIPALVLLSGVLLFLLAGLPVNARASTVEQTLEQYGSSLPEQYRESFGEGLSLEQLEQADVGFFVTLLGQTLQAVGGEALGLFGILAGVLLLLSFAEAGKLGGYLQGDSAGFLRRFGGLALALLCSTPLQGLSHRLEDYFSAMQGLLSGFLPVLEAIQLAGGNVSGATVSCTVLSLSCALLDSAGKALLLPLLRICLCITLLSVLSDSIQLRPVAEFAQASFGWLSGIYMAVLLGVFSFQNLLAASKDSVAARALRFTAGNTLPIVGGGISEAMKTLLSSLGLMKSLAGGATVVSVLLLTVPLLLRVFCFRICFRGAAAMAGMLQLGGQERLLRSFSRICDFCLAALAMCGAGAIFQLAIFLKSGFAIG